MSQQSVNQIDFGKKLEEIERKGLITDSNAKAVEHIDEKKLSDYVFESKTSFITDRTELLISHIRDCHENLNRCENREEMAKLLGERITDNINELIDLLIEIDDKNDGVAINFNEINRKLPLLF